MASEVDICNLALAHLGDTATVTSLDPPEGSAQAAHCARFYPIARDALLEVHPWGFATTRMQLALLGITAPEWRYAYAPPSDALTIIAVFPPSGDSYVGATAAAVSTTAQPFACEVDVEGNSVLFTNQPDAVLRYTSVVTDTTRFSPLFTLTLTWHLASMLAGPLLKGEAGSAEAKRCAAFMQSFLTKAVESDASQRRTSAQGDGGWINRR